LEQVLEQKKLLIGEPFTDAVGRVRRLVTKFHRSIGGCFVHRKGILSAGQFTFSNRGKDRTGAIALRGMAELAVRQRLNACSRKSHLGSRFLPN
jgi:hypothetical protein